MFILCGGKPAGILTLTADCVVINATWVLCLVGAFVLITLTAW